MSPKHPSPHFTPYSPWQPLPEQKLGRLILGCYLLLSLKQATVLPHVRGFPKGIGARLKGLLVAKLRPKSLYL